MSYHCDSVLVSCIDWRLHPYVDMFVHNIYGSADLISVPGAVKGILDETPDEQIFADIELSLKLHNPKTIVLTAHRDCGAYGGSAAFDNDCEREFFHHAEVLAKAAEVIHEKFSELTIVTLFLELDERGGRWVCTPIEVGSSGIQLDGTFTPRESADVA